MSKLVHAFGHGVIMAVTFVALYAGYVPGKYAPVALAAQGFAQAILALVNHKVVKGS